MGQLTRGYIVEFFMFCNNHLSFGDIFGSQGFKAKMFPVEPGPDGTLPHSFREVIGVGLAPDEDAPGLRFRSG